jgi:regulatory protein
MARRRSAREEPEDADRDLGPPADPAAVARTILLAKLTGQARSREELARALDAKDVPADVARTVLDRFEEVGLVDDQAFAEAWVESRQASRGLSRRALAVELRRKGIADDLIQETVSAIDPERERAIARGIVDRKLAGTRRLDAATRFRRLASALARKGYPPGLCTAVVREALAAESDDSFSVGVGFGDPDFDDAELDADDVEHAQVR